MPRPVPADERFEPRHRTPLYDAIGETIGYARRTAGKEEQVCVVVFTDGAENILAGGSSGRASGSEGRSKSW